MDLNGFTDFFKDEGGRLSSMRLAFLSFFSVFMVIWIAQSYHDKKIAPIDNSILYFAGLLISGKVGQSCVENFPTK